ncbi:response regulator [Roseobacter sp. S98]|uniref:response regulator n=1 Tax=Roseobacter algicola (ex Choi et al. 2025) (nom. illeg.) TaxID=3092138 RepID=UPI0035C6C40C
MTELTKDAEKRALETCEAEPIRTPNTVQPHGLMCVFDADLTQLRHVSANACEYLGVPPSDLLGKPATSILDDNGIHALRNALMLRTSKTQREYLGPQNFSGGCYPCAVHRTGDLVVLEASPAPEGTASPHPKGLESLRWLMARQHEHMPFSEGIIKTVRDLRNMINYDRVMLYRFRPDGSGEVIAEDRTPDIQSFLGLRFPAQDIPRIARNICMEQPVRLIADLSAPDSELVSMPGATERPDLTLAEFRGTSPVHVQYLRNMGIRSSLVLPVIHEGSLWGMFSCHHRKPRFHGIEETLNLELAGQLLQLFVGNMLSQDRAIKLAEFQKITAGFGERKQSGLDDLLDEADWMQLADHVCKELKVEGLSICSGTQRQEYGLQPAPGTEAGFDAELIPTQSGGIACSSKLTPPGTGKPQKPVTGMMRIRLLPDHNLFLRLYRTEENETVRWAGAPEKTTETDDAGTRLLPRSSFEEYRQQSAGHSRAWEPEDVVIAEALQTCIGRSVDIRRERLERENNFQLVIHELNHRVRNILSLIQSLIRQTSRVPSSLPHYAQALENRVLALARAHDLLTKTDSGILPVTDVVETEFAPHPAHQYQLDGRDVFLDKDTATVFVLVMHEMVTNAARHGALSVPEGQVSVSWFQRGTKLHLNWTEIGGPRVDDVATTGFGQFLIQQAVNDRLDGQTIIENHPGGVTMNLVLPGAIPERDIRKETIIRTTVPEKPATSLPRTFDHVLIVEDNPLIGAEIRFALAEAGVPIVSFAPRIAKAVEILEGERIDAAVLDVNLGTETSQQVAERLREKEIPFVFLTGYAENFEWLTDFSDVPVLTKPVEFGQLAAVLHEATTERRSTQKDNRRILIVEDNTALRLEMLDTLEQQGHEVTVAANGEDAIALSSEDRFDGIILDMLLSQENSKKFRGSLTLISRVKRTTSDKRDARPPVPLLAISGGTEIDGGYSPLRTARDLGADEWLRKPVREADLLAWVNDLPRRR